MILIISDKSDKNADRVESILQENASEYSRLNLDVDSLKKTQIKIEDNAIKIEGPNCSFSTTEVEAVWNRSVRIDPFNNNCSVCEKEDFICNEIWNKALEKLNSLLESKKRLNFYHDLYSEILFGQYKISKNVGLKWPSSICANDINYLNTFSEEKRDRILKLMEQDCKIEPSGDCFVKCIHNYRTAGIVKNQGDSWQLADFTYKVRCTVVGTDYFVGKIKSDNHRESHDSKPNNQYYTVFQPPKGIKMKAIQIMAELNLTHCVFDFIVTEYHEWFFEALNPTGEYKWVEDMQGFDIPSSITKWLVNHN